MQAHHYSQTFRHLSEVDPRDYQRIIRMYEEREAEIGRLDAYENFALTVYYVDALFNTGAYRQHQLMVDLVIEQCIQRNIQAVERMEGDVFQYLLFQKATSAYRLEQYEIGIHVGRELRRIDPQNNLYRRFLRIAFFKSRPRGLQLGRGIFIASILLAALLITLNLLVVINFFPQLETTTNWLIVLAFGVGMAGLLGAYSFCFWWADREAEKFRNGGETRS